MNQPSERRSAWSWWYLLFVIQFVAVLWPPFYNSVEPALWGIPFFYWYQLAWVIIGAISDRDCLLRDPGRTLTRHKRRDREELPCRT